jgi:hypothetical protein
MPIASMHPTTLVVSIVDEKEPCSNGRLKKNDVWNDR